MGTTQSAVATGVSCCVKHSPLSATLQRYAQALGYRVRLVRAHASPGNNRLALPNENGPSTEQLPGLPEERCTGAV